jgi:hypothetical protein
MTANSNVNPAKVRAGTMLNAPALNRLVQVQVARSKPFGRPRARLPSLIGGASRR